MLDFNHHDIRFRTYFFTKNECVCAPARFDVCNNFTSKLTTFNKKKYRESVQSYVSIIIIVVSY